MVDYFYHLGQRLSNRRLYLDIITAEGETKVGSGDYSPYSQQYVAMTEFIGACICRFSKL